MDSDNKVLRHCIERKVLDSSVTYRKENLQTFFEEMDKIDYLGPFQKSMFLQHTRLLKRCKEVGVVLKKSQRDRKYYIMKPVVSKPVLFDPSFIDKVDKD